MIAGPAEAGPASNHRKLCTADQGNGFENKEKDNML
jgi:hypothetical protein